MEPLIISLIAFIKDIRLSLKALMLEPATNSPARRRKSSGFGLPARRTVRN